MVLLGVKMAPENLVNRPHDENIFQHNIQRHVNIPRFIKEAYGARGETNAATMRVLVDCSWLLTQHAAPLHSNDVVNVIRAMFPNNANDLFVMLDFGSLGFGRNRGLSSTLDTFIQEIDMSFQGHDADEWYRRNLSILWPNQAVSLSKG